MKGFVFALTSCFLIISTHNNAFAQASKITAGVSMAMGGFSLDGNPDDNAFTATRRMENRSEADVVGAGFLLGYGVLSNLDAFYHWHYEYCNEANVDAYSLVMHDIGARYYVLSGGFRPFLNASFTKYTLNDLQIVDGAIASQVQLREYDYSGTGFSYGAGIDLSAGIMSLILEYTKTATSSFEKKEGSVDFENKPSLSRFSFSVRFRMF